jgi:DNA end-binding protein Ku
MAALAQSVQRAQESRGEGEHATVHEMKPKRTANKAAAEKTPTKKAPGEEADGHEARRLAARCRCSGAT